MFHVNLSSQLTREFTYFMDFSIHFALDFLLILDDDRYFGISAPEHASVIDIRRSHYNHIIINNHKLTMDIYNLRHRLIIHYTVIPERKELNIFLGVIDPINTT